MLGAVYGDKAGSIYGMNESQKKEVISDLANEYVKILKKVYK